MFQAACGSLYRIVPFSAENGAFPSGKAKTASVYLARIVPGENQRPSRAVRACCRIHHHAGTAPCRRATGLWLLAHASTGKPGYRISCGTLYPALHAMERRGLLKARTGGRSQRRLLRRPSKFGLRAKGPGGTGARGAHADRTQASGGTGTHWTAENCRIRSPITPAKWTTISDISKRLRRATWGQSRFEKA